MSHNAATEILLSVQKLGVGQPLNGLSMKVGSYTFEVKSVGKTVSFQGCAASHLFCSDIGNSVDPTPYAVLVVKDELWSMGVNKGQADFVSVSKPERRFSFLLESEKVSLTKDGRVLSSVSQNYFDNNDNVRLGMFQTIFESFYGPGLFHAVVLQKYQGIPGHIMVCQFPCVFNISCQDGSNICPVCSWWNNGCWPS